MFHRLLRPHDLVITNNHAFECLRGQHDIAVGSRRRFMRTPLLNLMQASGFWAVFSTYWPLVLFPMVWAVRSWQRLTMKRWQNKPVSDVSVPSAWVNRLLEGLVETERKITDFSSAGEFGFYGLEKRRAAWFFSLEQDGLGRRSG